jgi:hypothetical protein
VRFTWATVASSPLNDHRRRIDLMNVSDGIRRRPLPAVSAAAISTITFGSAASDFAGAAAAVSVGR